MPHYQPYPWVFFSLLPINKKADEAVRQHNNRHLLSIGQDGKIGLNVGFVRSESSETLATLGRKGDIILQDPRIARIQCSFEIHRETGLIMLYDRSNNQSTQVAAAEGDISKPFEPGRLRRVVVMDGVNTKLGMGGDFSATRKKVEERQIVAHGLEDEPRLARTVDNIPTVPPEQIGQVQMQPLKLRHAKISHLGAGSFGTVHKCVDVDTGRLMAVKILRRKGSSIDQFRQEFEREVKVLSQSNHNIVEFISSQSFGGEKAEIYMALKDGSVNDLIRSRTQDVPMGGVDTRDIDNIEKVQIAEGVLQQILSAIDYLACNEIIHRDIKPANILYTSQPKGGWRFQLTDFGVANWLNDAKTKTGTDLFMAPELQHGGSQTSKMDVWSLYVTILWVLDAQGLRSHPYSSYERVHQAILRASKHEGMHQLRGMAKEDPEKRASAAQILVMRYNGDGLTTPWIDVPVLNSNE